MLVLNVSVILIIRVISNLKNIRKEFVTDSMSLIILIETENSIYHPINVSNIPSKSTRIIYNIFAFL